jgi:hypothetical protein
MTTSIINSTTNTPDGAQQVGVASDLFVLSLGGSDRWNITPRNATLESLMADAIAKCWPKGLQSTRVLLGGDAFEFKLKGTPWRTWTNFPYRESGAIMLAFMQAAYEAGFVAQTSFTVALCEHSSNVLILRRADATQLPATTSFGISFFAWDRINLIGAPADVCALVNDTIRSTWRRGIQRAGDVGDGVYNFKLGGQFLLNGMDVRANTAAESHLLLARMQDALLRHGYVCCATVDITKYASVPPMMVFQKIQSTSTKK